MVLLFLRGETFRDISAVFKIALSFLAEKSNLTVGLTQSLRFSMFAYGDTCMHGYSYVVLTAKVCKSTMVTFDMLLQNKKGYRIKIDKFRSR